MIITANQDIPCLDDDATPNGELQSGEVYFTTLHFNGVERNPANACMMYAKSWTEAGCDSGMFPFTNPSDPTGLKPISKPVYERLGIFSLGAKFGVLVDKITSDDKFKMTNVNNFYLSYHYMNESSLLANYKLVACRFWLTYIQNGEVYNIDDLWIVYGHNKLYLCKNWQSMEPVDFTKTGQTIDLLAWRGTDASSRCVVQLTAGTYNNGDLDITIKFGGELQLGDQSTGGVAFDEFNVAVADMIRKQVYGQSGHLSEVNALPFIDFRPMIGSPADRAYMPDGYVIPVFDDYGQDDFTCSSVEVDPDTLRASTQVDYSSSTVMANNSTDPMTFKTPEYSHKHVETTQIQRSGSVKQTGKLTFKGTEKTTLDAKAIKEEFTVEQTIEVGWEISGTKTETKTVSDEKTYTCPGQTVVVPPGKSYQATCVWKKGMITGHIDTFYPLAKPPALNVIYIRHNTSIPDDFLHARIKTTMDLSVVEKMLGKQLGSLRMIAPKAEGVSEPRPYVLQRFEFTSEAGISSEFTIKPTGEQK